MTPSTVEANVRGQVFETGQLVLNVSESVDPSAMDLSSYGRFIDALCGDRSYQKKAIETGVRYLVGRQYADLAALIAENFASRQELRSAYGDVSEIEANSLFLDKLAATIDLATGTGKSYVLYGVAAILLAEGVVDRVLVLCPSLTIEAGLLEKFRALAADETLRALMPEEAALLAPSVITGGESIVAGSICVENYHSALDSSRSSLRPSLSGHGRTTLVLNDEAHHLRTGGADIKKWTEFVADPDLDFRLVLGMSGTCYNGDSYFGDVIYRYSLRQAIEDGYVKTVEYVTEDSPGGKSEKFQKIYDNHLQNRSERYRLIKPLTLLVTRDIAACKRLETELVTFVADAEGISPEEAGTKVLAVTSDPGHRRNLAALPAVDTRESPVEWIVSVSMLTEGWDVKNVCQVVPHEERAFSSKLLIAQVLGRGLRVPDVYKGERPVLIVYNHDAWSSRITHLVDEVLEIESRLTSMVIEKSEDYNFTIHSIDYLQHQEVETYEQEGEYDFSKGWVSLASQVSELERETVYQRVLGQGTRTKRTRVRYQMHTVNDVVDHIHRKFKAIDLEEGTTYADTYTVGWLRDLVRASLSRVGEVRDLVSEENRQRLLASFGVIHRQRAQTVRYVTSPESLTTIQTTDRPRDSVGVGALRRGEITLFLDEYGERSENARDAAVVQRVLDDESLPRSAVEVVRNKYNFRTPLNVVLADHRPERQFVRGLIKQENAAVLSGWIKSTDQGFYPIEFAWKRGAQFKRGSFNPDFFLAMPGKVLAIEIKEDAEIQSPSAENRAKYKAAVDHFALVDARADGTDYECHFLAPQDFDTFFQFLREGRGRYVSSLDAALGD